MDRSYEVADDALGTPFVAQGTTAVYWPAGE
jgi:hypothetical protein